MEKAPYCPIYYYQYPAAELFPVDMRAFLSGLCNFATNLYIFLVIKTFPDCKCALYCTVLYCTVLY